jgi:hypothetical protein
MSSSTIIFLEMALVLGLTLGFGLWELRSLRRDRKKKTDENGRRED